MSYCLNPHCCQPQNPSEVKFCVSCGHKLLLKDRYRPLKPIGQGGFGRTVLAIDEDKPSKPSCVIKQFFPISQGPQSVTKASQLFEQEAIRLDELGQHPQIPDLLAYFSQDNQQYLVQEFIAGPNLEELLPTYGTLDEEQIGELLQDLLPVLAFVHQKQVIHRDIKAANIILRQPDNVVFLVDFGASKAVNDQTLGQTGTAIGSIGYTAPEQAMGKATYASDLYSLGVTCLHLLTGLYPTHLFDAYEGKWIWRKFLKNPIDRQLGIILNRLLEPSLSQRYQSAEAVLQDLKVKFRVSHTDAIAQELQQLEVEFSQNQEPSAPTQPLNSARQIDQDLEALKEEFSRFNLGS